MPFVHPSVLQTIYFVGGFGGCVFTRAVSDYHSLPNVFQRTLYWLCTPSPLSDSWRVQGNETRE